MDCSDAGVEFCVIALEMGARICRQSIGNHWRQCGQYHSDASFYGVMCGDVGDELPAESIVDSGIGCALLHLFAHRNGRIQLDLVWCMAVDRLNRISAIRRQA